MHTIWDVMPDTSTSIKGNKKNKIVMLDRFHIVAIHSRLTT
jgi:hypothetical protein